MNTLRLAILVTTLGTAPAVLSQVTDTKAAKKAEAVKVIDPVCGMEVDPKTSEKAEYKGKTYYFCARSEKEEFQKNPDKYVSKTKKK